MKKLALASAIAVLAAAAPASAAFFSTYTGGTADETAWRTAAGSYVLETFNSFVQGTSIPSLPALGVKFDLISPTNGCTSCPPGYPAIYTHDNNTPSGGTQLSNMPVGGFPNVNYINADIMLRVLPGYTITALGYWNGDPQGPMTITVYDALDNVLGSVSAAINTSSSFNSSTLTFAGFVSDVPFDHILFEGNTGDGYNHIDDLQTNAVVTAAPEPGAAGLFAAALLLIGLWRAWPASRSRGRAGR